MTEDQIKLENLLLEGKFDLAIRFVQQSSFTNKDYLINEINILRSTPEATVLVNSINTSLVYSNLTTSTTDIEETLEGYILVDKNKNRLGIAIEGNEKQLLDYYSSQIYKKLSVSPLSQSEQLTTLLLLVKQYSIKRSGISYACNINGRTISFYPIGNNGNIHGYALTLNSKDGQGQKLIIDNANGLTLFFQGLRETFP